MVIYRVIVECRSTAVITFQIFSLIEQFSTGHLSAEKFRAPVIPTSRGLGAKAHLAQRSPNALGIARDKSGTRMISNSASANGK